MGGWYWYARDIKVPTLWDAVHQSGGTVASYPGPSASELPPSPITCRNTGARIGEDIKLVRALSAPGLVDMLEKSTGLTLAQADGDSVAVDIGRLRFTRGADRGQTARFHHRASARVGSTSSMNPGPARHRQGRAGRTGWRAGPPDRRSTQGAARPGGGDRVGPVASPHPA